MEAEKTTAARPSRPLVLVVDDEALLAMELEMVLDEAGFEVLGPAGSVSDALALIGGEHIDAAVLDVNLHDERSDDIADSLEACDVPFVFLTGHTREALPERHRHRPLIAKPFRESELLGHINSLVAQRSEQVS
ncbi:response regulator [Oceanicola granulosus HTCC2516]|uniref:Response regulator n=1 Tax=Oceanicola granulosus (strain ATCC BAA-861 / DSM 15982 / KCTC 12143 / HTCC2516) TaxID=314256 RepID=Q2CDY1_OCEGH|nr:response regulator [Oceanicola granulosus]EAR50847.1 response regulator [Oceanicola granulosus HTCC2516]